MPCDLEVDTDTMRFAAGLLRRAAAAHTERHDPTGPTTPDGHAAGTSAIAREALRLMWARSEQSVMAAERLAAVADVQADRLIDFAAQFEAAEALCATGS